MDWIWITGVVVGAWALLRLMGNERQTQIAIIEHRFRVEQELRAAIEASEPAEKPQLPPASTRGVPKQMGSGKH